VTVVFDERSEHSRTASSLGQVDLPRAADRERRKWINLGRLNARAYRFRPNDRSGAGRGQQATPLPPVVSGRSEAAKLANFPKNGHWPSQTIDDSIACKTQLSAR
jgi:hypothetical protein